MTDTDTKIQQILADFKPYEPVYKREAVEAALALKEEITPHLIKILEEAMAHPDQYFDFVDHIYAFILLGHFKETRAHKLIVDLFSLPEHSIEPLFGELVTEDLAMVLWRTCGGSIDEIKRLILNKEAYEYCRSAAIGALTYATVAGYVSREATLDFFSGLFSGNEAAPNDVFWSSLVSSICDLHPEELMPVIRQAFEDDLIDPIYIDLDYIEQEILPLDQEKSLERVRQEIEGRSLDDVHAYMSWWAMFHAEDSPKPIFSPPPPPKPTFSSPPPPKPALTAKKKAKKKKKRKLAKASRKKNRR